MNLAKDDIREVFNEGFEALISPRFDRLESRIDSIEGRMDSIDGRVDDIDGRMDGLENHMSKQEHATSNLRDEVRSGFSAVNSRIDDLEERLSTQLSELDVDVQYLYKLVEALQKSKGVRKELEKLTVEQKFITLYEQFQTVAKEAGITLPR